jgi:hypothetical protein
MDIQSDKRIMRVYEAFVGLPSATLWHTKLGCLELHSAIVSRRPDDRPKYVTNGENEL